MKPDIGRSPIKSHVQIFNRSTDGDTENSAAESDVELTESDNENNLTGDEDSEANDDSDNETNKSGNPGWADAMQKILRTKKPKRKKSVVLSKAKKLCDIKKVKEENFPIETGAVKKEPKVETSNDSSTSAIAQTQKRDRRRDHLGIRVKPNIADRERERMLQKIATKGVVQLFNAVKQQQTEINKKLVEAGPLERKKQMVLESIDKNAFLDVLMGGSARIRLDNAVKDEPKKEVNGSEQNEGSMWGVLRDDFVMGAKLKDWDKKDEEQADSSAPEDIESDN